MIFVNLPHYASERHHCSFLSLCTSPPQCQGNNPWSSGCSWSPRCCTQAFREVRHSTEKLGNVHLIQVSASVKGLNPAQEFEIQLWFLHSICLKLVLRCLFLNVISMISTCFYDFYLFYLFFISVSHASYFGSESLTSSKVQFLLALLEP